MNEVAVRTIRADELPKLLALYRHLHVNDVDLAANDGLERTWQSILANPQLHYLVVEENSQLVSSCTLAIIPNLTRGARSYALIENVVTDPAYRKRGWGTRVLQAALQIAWREGCYKTMLMTGRKDEATLRFYEHAGFNANEKTGFVAHSPLI